MKIEEVAMRLGVSTQTINKWYRFKRSGKDCMKDLPDYRMLTTKSGNVRDWTEEDVWKLLQFKQSIVFGRSGRMGKYGGTGSGKKIITSETESTIN